MPRQLIPDWNIPNPKQLWFADNPTDQPMLTLLSNIESIMGITWTEMVLEEPKESTSYIPFLKIETEELPIISRQEYIASLNDLCEKCVIRWLDKEIGWVITLQPGKTLKAGFFSCYTGMIKSHALMESSSYSIREYFFSLFKTETMEVGVDAKINGNVGRLLPFLLEPDYLENFDMDKNIKDKIAVANLQFKLALFNGVKMPCIFSPQDITAPADRELLLGVNYSLKYLHKMNKNNKIFKFIDKSTFSSLDPSLYPQKMIQIQLEGFEFSFIISRLRIMLAQYFPDLKYRTKGFDEIKKRYYEITVSDADIYNALMKDPQATTLTIKPDIELIKNDNS